jgi:hypothetical protein
MIKRMRTKPVPLRRRSKRNVREKARRLARGRHLLRQQREPCDGLQ